MGRSGARILTDDPSHLPVWIDTLPGKFCFCPDNEIAGKREPEEMELVFAEPHVGARSFHCVDLVFCIVEDRTAVGNIPDIPVVAELAERW